MWDVFLNELSVVSGVSRAALLAHDFSEKEHKISATLGDSVKESVHVYESCYYEFDQWTMRAPKQGVTGRIIQ
jgi:hypothetical protein